jgi:hypothetical protein
MSQTRNPRRLLASLTCATALIACEDSPVAPGSNPACTEVRASPNAAAVRIDTGQARIRVNLVSRLGADQTSGEGVSTSGVELYNGSTCFRLAASTLTRLGSVENDVGRSIADAVLTLPRITHIALQPSELQQGARSFAVGRIALAQPIALEAGTRTDIFLALDSVTGTQNIATRFVAAGAVPLNADVVMAFEPGREARASVEGRFAMMLPAGSGSQPAVYGIVAHDVAEVSPMLDIMPRGALAAPARLTLPIDHTRIPDGLSMNDYGAHVGTDVATTTVDGNTVSIDANAIGLTTVTTAHPYAELPNGRRVVMGASAGALSPLRSRSALRPSFAAQAQATDQCRNNLIANRTGYLELVRAHQFVRSTACMNVPPYVHIIFINIGQGLSGSQIYPWVLFPSEWYTGTTTFLLRTIMQHASSFGTYASVNGFLWDGNIGDGPNQTGTPKGTLYIEDVQRSPVYTGAEAIIGFGQTDSYLGTAALLIDKPSGIANLQGYTWNAVPSTTSIVKNGACSRSPTETPDWNRWSAIGIGNGLLILVSSLSDQETTSYELCAVFEGMVAYDGAIRMDGGPTAAIQWSTTHLNPLVGFAAFKYNGPARHIPYTVGAIP